MDSSSTHYATWMQFKSLPGIVVSPEMFCNQVKFLKRNYKIIPLEYLVRCIRHGIKIPDKSAVITFDDGWRDNYLFAFPILRKLEIPAMIFLSTGFIGTERLFWPEMLIYCLSYHREKCLKNIAQLEELLSEKGRHLLKKILKGESRGVESLLHSLIEELKDHSPHSRDRVMEILRRNVSLGFNEETDRRVMMNWEEVQEMAEAGISFGSHGIDHEILTKISQQDQVRELSESKRLLEDRDVASAPAFAYPNGNYNEEIKKLVTDAGYICAVSTEKGKVNKESDLFALKRINVHNDISRGLSGGFSKTLFAYHIDLRL